MFRVFSEPANSNVRYKVGNWHASFPQRKETEAAGLSFIAAATTSGLPDYRLQYIDSNLLFLPPARLSLRGQPFKVPQGMRHFRWGLWNTGISSRLSSFSRKGWRKFGQKSFPISPTDWTRICPFPFYCHHPTLSLAHHPLTVIISICYPTLSSIYVIPSARM